MRVKEGNVLQVTTNPFTTEGMIRKILTEHIKEIERMYEFQKKKELKSGETEVSINGIKL